MKNTKGLSAVVTTLIIILLAIVAVGIIWVVVDQVLKSGAEQIDYTTKCFAVDLEFVSVTAVTGEAGNYSVSLKRNAGGDEMAGVKVALFNVTGNSGVIDFNATIPELETVTQKINTTDLTGANKIEFTGYFEDASGNEHLCTTDTATF